MFSCELCEICKDTLFTEHLQPTSSLDNENISLTTQQCNNTQPNAAPRNRIIAAQYQKYENIAATQIIFSML